MAASFLADIAARRSIYALSSASSVSDAKIHEVTKQVVLHTPTSFNTQMVNAVVFAGAEHTKLWKIIKTSFVEMMGGAEAFAKSPLAAYGNKLDGFAKSQATITWWTDLDVVKASQERSPAFADSFPIWAHHSQGAAQVAAWTALEKEGLGGNLQHLVAPPIVAAIRKEWPTIPASWDAVAQLVVGGVVDPAGEKTFKPIEERVLTFGL